MSKKVLKKLLITTSLLSPIAIVTPVVLTTYGLSIDKKEVNKEITVETSNVFPKNESNDNLLEEVKTVDFIDLSEYDKKENDYVFKGILLPLNKNLKSVKDAKDWLIKKNSLKEESNALNFDDGALVELIDISSEKLVNETADSNKNSLKELLKKNINPHGVSEENTSATVTVVPREESSGKKSNLFTLNGDLEESQSVKSIKIEFVLKDGYSWASKNLKEDQPKVVLEFDVNYTDNILNPVNEFLKASGTEGNKEYLLVGTQFSNENETWQRISNELATLENNGQNNKESFSLNDKRVDVLASAFKDIEFNKNDGDQPETKNYKSTDDNVLTKKAENVKEQAKESISTLLKDVNLMNLIYSQTKSDVDVEYGSILYSGFLNLDYLFNVADVSLKVTSKKTPKKIINNRKTEYTIDSYSYDLEIIFTLKSGNKWVGLNDDIPIRILFSDLYDTKVSIGLDKVIDGNNGPTLFDDVSSQAHEFKVEFEDKDGILTNVNDENGALTKIYEKLPQGYKRGSGIVPPVLDSKKEANLDDKKYAANKLVNFLIQKMGDQDFTFGNKNLLKESQENKTSIKELIITDWFFTDRFSTKITVKKDDITPLLDLKNGRKKFTFILEFTLQNNYEWVVKDSNAAKKDIKLEFAISQKSF